MLMNGARWNRYHQTKLANAVMTVELAARLQAAGSKVKAVVAAPGLAATNLQVTTAQDDGMPSTWIMKRFAQSAEARVLQLHLGFASLFSDVAPRDWLHHGFITAYSV